MSLMQEHLDPRIHPYRGDLASSSLRGRVASNRFVVGEEKRLVSAISPLRRQPSPSSERVSELLYGESFIVYEEKDGWAWGQAGGDGYVGYVGLSNLGKPSVPTHIVKTPLAILFEEPDLKAPRFDVFPMGARLSVQGFDGDYAQVLEGKYISICHLASLESIESDYVLTAEKFLNAPYLWGGRTALGIDCSGLVQTALQRSGRFVPRDTDMLEQSGMLVPGHDSSILERGDVLFWKGHCALVLDQDYLIHANTKNMGVAITPLVETVERYKSLLGLQICSVRRFPDD